MFGRKPIITFSCDETLRGAIPDPIPASEATPKWFRKMSYGEPTTRTVKRCIPFKDSMDMGYILPLWVDLHVTNRNGVVSFGYNDGTVLNSPILEDHNPNQLAGCPLTNTTYGNQPMKFINPWLITTPPGWSCLFIQPINHFDDRLKIMSGVVDTDVYTNKVNFPFVWMDKEFNGLMLQGTPLVQVIPFKRESWNHKILNITEAMTTKIINTHKTSLAVFINAYRFKYWQRKEYK